MRIWLDAGHGGSDPGAVGNGLQEKDVALSVTVMAGVGRILEQDGFFVGYTRTTDVFVGINDRARNANNWRADLFVSIHCDSFTNATARGAHVIHRTGSPVGQQLATAISRHIVPMLPGRSSAVVGRTDLGVLNQTNMPAVLVEMGFISNAGDAEIQRDRQDELARAIVQGIYDQLGFVPKQEDPIPPTTDVPSDWARAAWNWAIAAQITDGTNPQGACTREQVITFLYRMATKNGLLK